MAKPIPERIGKYKVAGVLGRGGMGLVYRALDQNLGREVAIKTLTEGFAGDAEMLERLYEEAKKTSKLKHPNIVTIYDLGEQDGFPYIVMEFVAGDAIHIAVAAVHGVEFLLTWNWRCRHPSRFLAVTKNFDAQATEWA